MALVEISKAKVPDAGQKGDPVAPAINAYEDLGVKVSRSFIARRRAHSASGAVIDRVVAAGEIVRAGNVSSKDVFFREYAILGVTKRKKRTDDGSKAFGYKGLKRKIIGELGVSDEVMGSLVKALRIDLFYTPVDQLGVAFPNNFITTVEKYLKDIGKYKDKQKAEEISRKWNRSKTVKNFTQIILNEHGETVAAWTPYEMEPISILAVNRLNHHSRLTPFDTMVLSGIDGDRSDKTIIAKIKADIGINIPRQVINSYRALLMGRIKANTKNVD